MSDPQTETYDAAPLPETGHAAVDEVLASLEGLSDLPAAEHVAVFESAHERLRATLSGDGPAPGTPGA